MRLNQFIKDNIEPILVDWEAFARTMIPPAETMTVMELRNHARLILLVIAKDMDTAQSERERKAKSKGRAKTPPAKESFSALHGELRQRSGFDFTQLAAEYRALRATVLRLWMHKLDVADAAVLEDVMRFNEGIDQSLAEAVAAYSELVDHSRDTFLAVLGHDLRNPLSALGTCLALLDRTDVPAQKSKTLQIAKRSITSINEMVTDLLEYTRTRLGRGIEVKPKPGNFATLCRQAFDEVCAAHPRRNLSCDIPEDVPLAFDAPRMRQVLTNLLSNAVHHGDAAFPILLVVRDDEAAVTMVVKNQGTPIPAEALQVIFNPLVQVEAKESELHERPATSLGLGLFIAREIVTRHGGAIDVTSTAGEGTAFSVHLPRTAG
jgi:signal transduction histidine kinase